MFMVSFRSMDQTILESRQLDLLFDQMLAARAGSSNTSQESSSAVQQFVPSVENASLPFFSSDVSQTPFLNPSEYIVAQKCTWKGEKLFSCVSRQLYLFFFFADVVNQAVSRGACDCAICMVPVSSNSLFPNSSVTVQTNNKKHAILSCSHIFHEWCITSFENFSLVEVRLLLLKTCFLYHCFLEILSNMSC
jgi:hypothetical protein